MKKISTKIIAAIVFFCLVTSIIITTATNIVSKGALKTDAESNLLQTSVNKAQTINEGLISTKNTVDNLESLFSQSFDLNKVKTDKAYADSYAKFMSPIMKNLISRQPNLLGVALIINPELTDSAYQVIFERKAGEKDVTQLQKFTKSQFQTNNPDMTWYYNPINSKTALWSDPHTDSSSTSMRMAYTKPIYINNQLIGVIAVDLFFNDYKNMINNVKIYDKGHASLLNKDTKYLVDKKYTDKDTLKTVLGNTVDVISKDSGIQYYEKDGIKSVLAYTKLYNGNIMIVSADESDIFKVINNNIILSIIITLIVCIITSIIALFIGKRLSDPIVFITGLVNLTSTLDFRENDKFSKINNFKDESGIIGKAVLNLREILKDVLIDIKKCSDTTSGHSINLNSVTEELQDSLTAINSTVIELANGAEAQANDAQDSSEKLGVLSDKVENIISITDTFNSEFETAKTYNDKAIKSIDTLMDKIKSTTEIELKTSNSVKELAEKSSLIENIVLTINGISTQTNLLALNAAIEAARAGEAGRGFGVVAEQIRALSEQTADSTKKIETIINDIRNEISITEKNMDASTSNIIEVNNSINESKQSFADIKLSFQTLSSKVDTLISNIDDIKTSKESVVDSIQGITAICEQSAAATEEVSATVHEQLSSVANVREASESLKNLVNTLEELLGKFTL
ncbi:methyl-accepting chemotaxis protein [Inconstantimicrobium mannanitabidum]|uniref:Methyl-accepting chemotaxis protein n=1 Tax=Inconstantimicrobium mannanitabidum TaxID=1604901 RepID=A0ACB5RGD4_9CLOT|nr:methyl-accepting chemotaxis protein [Clostridium sp. TW13]GKX68122.1 methyl-accepting chemotaxis protein [Clostridium sp. TW13]